MAPPFASNEHFALLSGILNCTFNWTRVNWLILTLVIRGDCHAP